MISLASNNPSCAAAAHERVSVALCTYNGAAYIREQLVSILSQTRAPDEIVIYDDRSDDDTVAVAREILAAAQIENVLHINERRLGSTANFCAALARCSGDIIFLSDQDDVWVGDKIARMLCAFTASPTVFAVVSDSWIAGPRLEPSGETMWQAMGVGPAILAKVAAGAPEFLLARPFATGAAMAVRAELLKYGLPIPDHSHMLHDRWFALIAVACGRIMPIADPLIYYRQHGGQQVGGPSNWRTIATDSVDPRRSHRAQLGFYRDLWRLLAERGAPVRPCFALTLATAIEHLTARVDLPGPRLKRLATVACEIFNRRYFRFSSGWKSAAHDLVRS